MAESASSNFLVSEAHLLLDEARRQKAERTKFQGDPIQLTGKALAILVCDNNIAWIADSAHVARKLDLDTGSTLALFRGHMGPVTTLAVHLTAQDRKLLLTGAWDKTIKLWDADTARLLFSIEAHGDFVKSLLVLQPLSLLISSGSDKIIRFWDLSCTNQEQHLIGAGSLSSHIRPVEALDGKATSTTAAILCTGDTMGVIKVWDLEREPSLRWKPALRAEYSYHRTRINELVYGPTQLWTASADETVQMITEPLEPNTPLHPKKAHSITHPLSVRCVLPLSVTDLGEPYLITGCGDVIRVYDVSSIEEPELLREVDSHWHDVTVLRLWNRKFSGEDGKLRVEPWIISASLDSTIRRWRLLDLLSPAPPQTVVPQAPKVEPPPHVEASSGLTEEEERELAELMDD